MPQLEGGQGGQIPPGIFETKGKILLKYEKFHLLTDEFWIVPSGMKFLTKVLLRMSSDPEDGWVNPLPIFSGCGCTRCTRSNGALA